MDLHLIIEAGAWGLFAGFALVIGACIGYFLTIEERVVGLVVAFGSGVLIATLAFELIEKSYESGGWLPVACGFLAGAIVYCLLNKLLCIYGTVSRPQTTTVAESAPNQNSGLGLAMGAILDGIPESMAIGISLTQGSVGIVAAIAVFLSNIPEGLSSAASMKKSGSSILYIMGIWICIAVLLGVASVAGFLFFDETSTVWISIVLAFAAGAILAMLSNTMMPEAYASTHDLTGVITGLGFLLAFILGKLI